MLVTGLSGSWRRMPRARTVRRQARDRQAKPESCPSRQGHECDGRTLPSTNLRPRVSSSLVLAACTASQPFAGLSMSALLKAASWQLCSAQPTAAASYHGIAQQACSTAQTSAIGLRPFWPRQSEALPSEYLDDEQKVCRAPADCKDITSSTRHLTKPCTSIAAPQLVSHPYLAQQLCSCVGCITRS